MSLGGIEGVTSKAALRRIGMLIDLSGDLQRPEATMRALQWSDALEQRGIPEGDAALLEYFRANAWAVQRSVRHRSRPVAWAWEQPELQKEVFHLRRAARHSGFQNLGGRRQCQVFTNLGNALNTVGRFVDALEYWGRALQINPHFAMALGNRGYGLKHYAQALYDGGHRAVFLKFAHAGFAAAVGPDAEYESPGFELVRSGFEGQRKSLESVVGDRLSQDLNLEKYELGASKEERSYRRWCLGRQLFLNPLNDLGEHAIAAHDVLTLPDFVTSVDEPPTLIGLFNQMKQEYVSARWLYYDGIQSGEVHFSDRSVLLYNTLDYPICSLAIEKVKAAYRAAYSIFDKVGFFLNAYMKIGMPSDQVSFRRIWFGNEVAGRRTIRSEFEQSENWPLRGLFWLSKDLYEKGFRDVMEPDAEALCDIRNHLEHKYLKVHDTLHRVSKGPETSGPWEDRLAYSIHRPDFEAKTVRLLKLARAAMIYLSLGMHVEEARRSNGNGGLVVPMDLDTWDDDWRR